MMEWFAAGFIAGWGTTLVIAAWLAGREREKWCDLFDMQQAIIEELLKQRGNP